ncbi:helix-turn-helix transcriptional regulator [Alkalibacterium iburiense]|uniref:Helix-turn-helix transcriptional regulator n=1 Tax=Alkalibacterium iburiense TaxID=290589 RepID=A0ABN0X2C2_9LACT
MDIGNRIQEVRKASNMTAKELAQRVEVSPSFISAVENNDSKLSLKTLTRICAALGVTLAEFFNEEATVIDSKLQSVISRLPEEKKWQLLNFLEGLVPEEQ